MRSPKDRDDVIQQIMAKLRLRGEPCSFAQKLSWPEILEMARDNISFGSHTVTHPILTRMPVVDAVREITDSKETIERHLKVPVKLFAYPNGSRTDFNGTIKDILKQIGFCCAVSTLWGANDRDTDAFELRRVRLWGVVSSMSVIRLAWYKVWTSGVKE
jgi:peptidoglycan/xylan/chitin deacetylase (PgdA/CDA1 family)